MKLVDEYKKSAAGGGDKDIMEILFLVENEIYEEALEKLQKLSQQQQKSIFSGTRIMWGLQGDRHPTAMTTIMEMIKKLDPAAQREIFTKNEDIWFLGVGGHLVPNGRGHAKAMLKIIKSFDKDDQVRIFCHPMIFSGLITRRRDVMGMIKKFDREDIKSILISSDAACMLGGSEYEYGKNIIEMIRSFDDEPETQEKILERNFVISQGSSLVERVGSAV